MKYYIRLMDTELVKDGYEIIDEGLSEIELEHVQNKRKEKLIYAESRCLK